MTWQKAQDAEYAAFAALKAKKEAGSADAVAARANAMRQQARLLAEDEMRRMVAASEMLEAEEMLKNADIEAAWRAMSERSASMRADPKPKDPDAFVSELSAPEVQETAKFLEQFLEEAQETEVTSAPAKTPKEYSPGRWYLGLNFVCTPMFMYGDGSKGYFIADLGPDGQPERCLVAFEDKYDAEGFMECLMSWDQFSGCRKGTVIPQVPRTMEGVAIGAGTRLLTFAKGQLTVDAETSEAELAVKLAEAYEAQSEAFYEAAAASSGLPVSEIVADEAFSALVAAKVAGSSDKVAAAKAAVEKAAKDMLERSVKRAEQSETDSETEIESAWEAMLERVAAIKAALPSADLSSAAITDELKDAEETRAWITQFMEECKTVEWKSPATVQKQPPPADLWHRALEFVCVPVFVFADGRKGYFTTNTADAGAPPDNRLLCFQSRAEAQAFEAVASSWPQFAGAKFSVIPAVPQAMERVALSKTARLLCFREGEAQALSTMAGTSEEAFAAWLQGAAADHAATSATAPAAPAVDPSDEDALFAALIAGNKSQNKAAAAKAAVEKAAVEILALQDKSAAEKELDIVAIYARMQEEVNAARAALGKGKTSTAAFDAEAKDEASVREFIGGFLEEAARSKSPDRPATVVPEAPWYRALDFVCAPVFAYADGTKAYFTVQRAGEKALIAFESVKDAEAYLVTHGATVPGAAKSTVVPVVPGAMESFARAQGCGFDVVRAAEAVTARPATPATAVDPSDEDALFAALIAGNKSQNKAAAAKAAVQKAAAELAAKLDADDAGQLDLKAAYATMVADIAAAKKAAGAAPTSAAAIEAEAAPAEVKATKAFIERFTEAAKTATFPEPASAEKAALPVDLWHRELLFVCTPTFVYGDGTKGFFTTTLGGERCMVAFERRRDAEAFVAATKGMAGYDGATRATVVPTVPLSTEGWAVSQGCKLVVFRRGALSVDDATGADALAGALAAAYEDRAAAAGRAKDVAELYADEDAAFARIGAATATSSPAAVEKYQAAVEVTTKKVMEQLESEESEIDLGALYKQMAERVAAARAATGSAPTTADPIKAEATEAAVSETAAFIEKFASQAKAAQAVEPETAPVAATPGGGVWYRSMPFLCVPQFIYADGGRGFFIVDLGGEVPDRRLVCFEDKADAGKFADTVGEWDQFRVATKSTVGPVQPREMEAVAATRQCSLLVLRKGQVVTQAGATEADVVRALETAYGSPSVLA